MRIKFTVILFFFLPALLLSTVFAENPTQKKSSVKNYPYSFTVKVSNPLSILRTDEVISIQLKKIENKYPLFNTKDFFVTFGKKEVPSQVLYQNGNGKPVEVLFIASFKPNDNKTFVFHYSKNGNVIRQYKQRTQAELGIKTDYKKVNGYYTGGKFVNIDSTIVPKDHFAHDALYRIEGPGWESDLIAYRFYLDSRNRNDITGKKTYDMIIQKMGVHDLVSNSKESYTKMLSWGMDIYKVGESLGIGSIAMWHNNKVNTVSNLDEEKCKIAADGPIQADVLTNYLGWKVGNEKYDLASNLSINASSRLTKVNLNLRGKPAVLCTGLAIHPDCTFLESGQKKNVKWNYIALYGKQSLAGDNLGTALFYKTKDAKEVTQDSLSKIVVLNPVNGKLIYYFAAAWQQEPSGIKNIDEFKAYLNKTILELSEPVKVSL